MSDETSSRSPRRSGGQGNRNNNSRQRSGQNNSNGNRRPQGDNKRPNNGRGPNSRGRRPLKKLTFWERLLTFLGVYDPRRGPLKKKKPAAKKAAAKKTAGKSRDNDRGRSSREKLNIGDPVNNERKPRERRIAHHNKLRLSNLSYDATESDLEDLFKGIGAVRRAEIVYNRETHRSKGIGFITMANEEEAQRAIDVLNEQFFLGRKLSVKPATNQAQPDEQAAEKETEKEAVEA